MLIRARSGFPLIVIGIVTVTFEGLYHFGPSPSRVPYSLSNLSEVDVCAELFLDGRNVAAKTVHSDLKSSSDSLAQVLDEVIRAGPSRFASTYDRTIFVSLSIAIQMYRSPHSFETSPCR